MRNRDRKHVFDIEICRKHPEKIPHYKYVCSCGVISQCWQNRMVALRMARAHAKT